MWNKPQEVVPEHRWRAWIVWASLLVSITAYTIWQGWNMYDDYKHPSTSLEVKDEIYDFPYVLVCFFHGFGCGWDDGFVEECKYDSLDFASVLDHNQEVRTDVVVETEWSNCVGFDLTRLNVVEAGIPANELSVRIDMEWTVTDIASTETEYYDNMAVYLSEEEPTESTLSFLYVPYTRYIPNDEAILPLTLADLIIGKTTKENLDGDVTTTFPALTLGSSEFASINTGFSQTDTDFAYGQLNIRLTQGVFSRTSVKELSPLDLGGFFGNIGGFWELLIVLWGVFFIATRDDKSPTMRARKLPSMRRRSVSVDTGVSASQVEAPPHWGGPALQASNPAPAGPPVPPRGGVTPAGGTAATAGFPVMTAPMNGGNSSGHRRQSNGSSSSTGSSRRPVVQDAPRRGSRSGQDPRRHGSRAGGDPPAHKYPEPPNYFEFTRAT